MSTERYIAVSLTEWESAVNREGKHAPGLGTRPLNTLQDASQAANGLATHRQEPYYVVKLVPVSLHRATIDVHVDQL